MTNQDNINPATLVSVTAKPRLTMSVIVSFGLHIVLLGLFSIGFIGQCIKYGTISPKTEIKRLAKEAEEADRQKKRQEAAKIAQLKAKEINEQKAKAEAEAKKNPPTRKEKPQSGKAQTGKNLQKDPYANQKESPDKAIMNEHGISFD